MSVKGLIVVEDTARRSRPAPAERIDALAQVANRAIAHHVLDRLFGADVDEVIVATSADMRPAVEASFSVRAQERPGQVTYLERPGPLDLAGALLAAAETVGEAPCIAHLGSGLLIEPLIPLIERFPCDSPDVAVIAAQESSDLAPVKASGRQLRLVRAEPLAARLSTARVCLFGPRALQRTSRAISRFGTELELASAAEAISTGGGRLRLVPRPAWRGYAGDPLDLLELNRIVLDEVEGQESHGASAENRIEGPVRIDEQATINGSVIIGPVVIGPGARITNTYIGPYTSIGAGAQIEGAEIERSIISPGATIMHIGARLTASVVGRDARIFRDFSLPRALRFRVGDGTEVALC